LRDDTRPSRSAAWLCGDISRKMTKHEIMDASLFTDASV
jgi:hypothetical protein